MKNVFKILLVSMLIISCNSDDDSSGVPTETEEDNLTELEVTQDFLTNEKWYLYEVSYIELEDDLMATIEECELDNYYIFEPNVFDFVTIFQGDNVCENADDIYASGSYEYEINNSSLSITALPDFLLGGIENNDNRISDIQAFISNDSSFKVLKGNFNAKINFFNDDINYSLIAYSNDRP